MADFGNAFTGAVTGASAGSSFGVPGALIGGAAGGILGLFGGNNKKPKAKKISTLDKKQQALYQEYVDALHGQGPFADLYGFDAEAANANFENMYSRPAYRQFQENVIPKITGQFRGSNLMNSTYAGESLSRAGRDVQESLDAQRANMIYQGTQDALNRKQNSIDNILRLQTFAYQQPQQGSGNAIDQILGTLAPYAGQMAGDFVKGGGLTNFVNSFRGGGASQNTAAAA
jgi:hypothetical protein